jgi:hypothetical protein
MPPLEYANMHDVYGPVRTFLDAAGREFNNIVDALARSNLRTNLVSGANQPEKGMFPPVQVVAQFRTTELDTLHALAVQCAAASPLKEVLLPLLKKTMKAQLALRDEAIEAEDAGPKRRGAYVETLPVAFIEKYCHILAELRRYVGAGSVGDPKEAGERVIWYHGEKSYSTDGHNPRNVSDEMHNALQAFLDRDVALSAKRFVGVTNVSKVIAKIGEKFGAEYVSRGKGKGDGYSLHVRTVTPTR